MDKNVKNAVKRMKEIQKIRAGYSKKLVTIEQNLTRIGWEIMVGDIADGDAAMEKAVKSVDGAIGNLHEALNALGRVEPSLKSSTTKAAASAPIASKAAKK